MEAPKCKICGENHWGSVCQKIASVPNVDRKTSPPATVESEVKEISNIIAENAAPAPSTQKRAPNGTFDRKAYQRELMRKRRAKAKLSQA